MYLEERARKYEYKLNDTDDQIIEYIIKNKQEITHLSIQSLASTLFTVPNTITRLCKKLGYDGYSQLKNNLKDELLFQDSEQEKGLQLTIRKTFEIIDNENLHTIVNLIRDASRIIFFGVGDSVQLCEIIIKNLKVIDKPCEFSLHLHETRLEIANMKKGDILFLVSMSGETNQVLEMANLAKSKGKTVLSFTHFSKNSLQQVADVNLYCYAPRKELNGHNITDKTSPIIVIRTLSEMLWGNQDVYKYT